MRKVLNIFVKRKKNHNNAISDKKPENKKVYPFLNIKVHPQGLLTPWQPQ